MALPNHRTILNKIKGIFKKELPKPLELYNVDNVTTLLLYHNELVTEFKIPSGELIAQIDDGYTGECYYIKWENDGDSCTIYTNNEGSLEFYYSIGGERNFSMGGFSDVEIVNIINRIKG